MEKLSKMLKIKRIKKSNLNVFLIYLYNFEFSSDFSYGKLSDLKIPRTVSGHSNVDIGGTSVKFKNIISNTQHKSHQNKSNSTHSPQNWSQVLKPTI